MNTLELKNKIIKQIDSLNDTEFENVYNELLHILKSANHYKLSKEENEAIDTALTVSEEGESYSHDEIVAEAKNKFPNLKFK